MKSPSSEQILSKGSIGELHLTCKFRSYFGHPAQLINMLLSIRFSTRGALLPAMRAMPTQLARRAILNRQAVRGITDLLKEPSESGPLDLQKIRDESSVNDLINSAQLTGVMDYQKQKEVLMFVDCIYPRWLAKLGYSHVWGWVFKPLNLSSDDQEVKRRLMSMINSEKHRLPPGAECANFVALRRDGGAFIKYFVPPNSSPKTLVCAIEKNLAESQREGPFQWISKHLWATPQALLVKGTPWIEDLSRFPSSQLKVIIEGESLTEEELYSLFRRYGLIVDITPYSSSTGFAKIVFKSTNACIRAKNCVTGMTLNDRKTTLHLQYIPMERVNHITSFISSHQRIAIPVIFAILATIAVLIFEPIRQQFIEIKIKRWQAYKNNWIVRTLYTPYKFLMSWLSDSRHFLDDSLESITGGQKRSVEVDDVESDMIWSERSERAKEVRFLLSENANTFIVIKGPKGSAEREFVMEHVLNSADTTNKILEIDCAELIKARSDKNFLKAAAAQIGYFPLFTWTNTVSQFIDLGLQGLTGQKSGLSESKEAQYKNMLLLTQAAIRKVSLSDFSAYKCEFEHQQQKKLAESGNGVEEFKIVEMKEENYLQQHPEVKPVIVINNFMRRTDSSHDFVFKELADWAGQLIQNNLAHVIFITLDSGSSVHLTAALPNQVFKTISLDDASPKSARQYVNRQLKNKYADTIDMCLEPLGGRMLDLQAFVRRVKSGEEPGEALKEMIRQASEQLSTFYLNVGVTGSEMPWDTAQLWKLIRLLAENDTIEVNDLVKIPLFGLSPSTINTLNVLEKNDIISLKRDKGITKSISIGRPIFKAAFRDLVSDEKIFQIYETFMFNQLISLENVKIAKMEDQFSKLSSKDDASYIKERLEYISTKLKASTQKVQEYEKKVKELTTEKTSSRSSIFGF